MSSVDTAIAILRQSRANLVKLGDSLSSEQLLKIPQGCNNNILWNLAHLPVTTCLLTRGLAGLDLGLDADFVEQNRKGASPTAWTTPPEWSTVRSLLTDTAKWVADDFASNRHENFKVYPTSFGLELSSAEQALQFNNVHDGIHLGIIMAYRHLV